MEKIKITSDPYNKDIKYEVWNDEENKWTNIDNPKSKLLNQKYIKGFLPFIITNIIKIIIEEYYTNEDKIEIIFEGNSDEYNEVKKVCEYDEYKDKLTIKKSEKYLENAREIQPVIKDVFSNNIHPIIFQTEDFEQTAEELESIKQDNKKYNETIEDTIPICVVGNYSAGKSSFINSLIGKEILPSGTKPMTSRIHKIFETDKEKSAKMSFSIKEFDKKRLFSIETSIEFWKEKCSNFKETLIKVISGSKNLDDEKKNELKNIIIEFEDIKLENYSNEIFEERNSVISVLNNFFQDILHIKFKSLADKYNEILEKQVNDMKDNIKISHKNSFVEWKNKLIKEIKGDILNYSPVLHEKQQKIDDQQAKIDRLKSKLDKLNIYSKQINDMLKWK